MRLGQGWARKKVVTYGKPGFKNGFLAWGRRG